REDVVAAARILPEALVEGAMELLRLSLEPLRERTVAPDLARELGHPPLRVVDVALHLARSDRRVGDRAVVESLRVTGVLPRLVFEPVRGAALVLDEAVPVAVAVLVDPAERPERRLLQRAHERRVVRPAPDLREQDQIEPRRVRGAVVGVEPV